LERVKAGPQESDKISVFTLEALVKIVKDEFGKTFTDGGLSKLLHRQGLSRIKQRPCHPKNDRAAMTEFREKTLPLFMRKRAKKTLIKKSA
jgi:transposase